MVNQQLTAAVKQIALENGLLVTKEFGSAIRISWLLTLADLDADRPSGEDACDHCLRCLDACPVNALV
jgi:epoxyqueuosine reductase QueG